jgi:CheY-like chemotaxis protein
MGNASIVFSRCSSGVPAPKQHTGVMPPMGGRHVVERLRSLRPETRILYMSGYTDDTVLRHGVAKAEAAFLQKPFTADALTRKVQEVLEEPPMVAARVAGA